MAKIRVLSGGAAQAVVEAVAAQWKRETGNEIDAEFSAVGAMAAKVVAGEAVDVAILTVALIDQLSREGFIVPGSRADLGSVGTGVAVRAGTPLPDVSSAHVLRGNMLAAKTIVCPDPAAATAGKVVMKVAERLGITSDIAARLRFFPNGYAAMRWLAASTGELELGITQVTEILPNKGVTLAGPLPEELQSKTVYSAGLATRAQQPEAAKAFMSLLTAPATLALRTGAGYEV